MLTAEEAAGRLNTYPRRVRYWCERGHLPGAEKKGRDWLIPESALAGFTPPKQGRKRAPSASGRVGAGPREGEETET